MRYDYIALNTNTQDNVSHAERTNQSYDCDDQCHGCYPSGCLHTSITYPDLRWPIDIPVLEPNRNIKVSGAVLPTSLLRKPSQTDSQRGSDHSVLGTPGHSEVYQTPIAELLVPLVSPVLA